MTACAFRSVHLALFAIVAAVSVLRGVGALARLVLASHGLIPPLDFGSPTVVLSAGECTIPLSGGQLTFALHRPGILHDIVCNPCPTDEITLSGSNSVEKRMQNRVAMIGQHFILGRRWPQW